MTATIRDGFGPDPFDGESTFTEETLHALADYVATVAAHLRLADWDIDVSRGLPTSKESNAETFIRNSAPEAIVAFADVFADYPEPKRRAIIAHEVLHPVLNPIVKYARDVIDGELGHTAEAIFVDTITEFEEQVIDRLAKGIASLLPKSPNIARKSVG